MAVKAIPALTAAGALAGSDLAAVSQGTNEAFKVALSVLATFYRALLGLRKTIGATGVGAPVTGTTVQTTLATIAIPAGEMGPNGIMRIIAWWSSNNSGGNKTPRIKYGGTTFGQPAALTGGNIGFISITEIVNQNNAALQIGTPLEATGPGVKTTAFVAGTENSAAALNVTLTGQLSSGGDTLTLERYIVEVIYKA